MRRRYFWITLLVLALWGAGAGWAGYYLSRDAALHRAAQCRDAEAWLRLEFQVSEEQMQAIRALQVRYENECEQHCAAILAARQELNAMAKRPGTTPGALAAQRAVVQEREQYCESAIAAHLRRVAALMSPGQGERYLALLLPRVAEFDHRQAPNLRLNQ